MRIAQVSTLSAPVRQNSWGSVEAWLWLLTQELIRRGHEVTVFASADSELPAGELVPTQSGPYGSSGAMDDWYLCEWQNLCRAVEDSARFDIVHTHAYLWGLPLEPFAKAPMVHTTHIVPDENCAKLWDMRPSAKVTALSRHQWSEFPQLKPAAVIPHGVDIAQFPFSPKPEDYLCYLGRFVSGKGPLRAIEAARSLGIRLLMAGPENSYFREKIKPLLDGRTVEYVGYLSATDRNKLLAGAKALLYPIQHPEAFGLVLIESMLCGTPVAAMKLGAVPEIVDDGITGWMAERMEDLPSAATKCFALNRAVVRKQAETRFSADRMTANYINFYEQLLRQ